MPRCFNALGDAKNHEFFRQRVSKEVEKGPVEVWGGRMKASFIQRGTIVKGTERLSRHESGPL